MQTFTTPMMKQYIEIKEQYRDCLLFFRLGDFYELFLEDAHIGAKVLDITLTARPEGRDGKVPMAGIPFHAVDSYLGKLVKAGYKVAICEQIAPPDKYGITKRDVVRIVTPGTILDEKTLNNKENNYIVAIKMTDNAVGIAAADITTGDFFSNESTTQFKEQFITDELTRLKPAECLLDEQHYNNPEILRLLKHHAHLNIFCFHNWSQYGEKPENHLKKHFAIKSLVSFGMENKALATETSSVLLGYLKETQKEKVNHFNKILFTTPENKVSLDRSTIINLELFGTIRDGEKKGSLIGMLDETSTSMGGRMLRQWITSPLANEFEINKRLDAVVELNDDIRQQKRLITLLEELSDIERILSRLSVGIGNARDLVNLKNSLKISLQIKEQLEQSSALLIQEMRENIDDTLNQSIELIDTHIVDEPPIDTKGGGLIKPTIDKNLDMLRETMTVGHDWVSKLEKEERDRTGINSLKVRFNKVFGFFIEVSNSNLHNVPNNYIRKQTLVNNERFITPELKKQEEIILKAEEQVNDIEYELFVTVTKKVLAQTNLIQKNCKSVAAIDCLINFAHIAQKYNYIKPLMTNDGVIKIVEGRHPVVELLLEDTKFVPNDVLLNKEDQQLIIITGPNMAGKSVYIRQTALIVLLAQIGSFVPASEAEISVVDKIFVRSGASDVITSGLSTFMVEMVETAHILNNATDKSLIVMDEIGRGTSTYDGISIAWAVAEYLVTNKTSLAKTLFATHYHELQELENKFPDKIKNYHMAIEVINKDPVFLHTIMRGSASHSFGVAVAKIAGMPATVVNNATQILHKLEKREPSKTVETTQIPLFPNQSIIKELQDLDIHNLTPLQALNKLADLKNKV